MESNRDVFLRMSEEHFLNLNEREKGTLHQYRVDEEKSDFSENLKDVTFCNLYKTYKETKKHLSEREYQLREQKRKTGVSKTE